jgi:hypothetical protein
MNIIQYTSALLIAFSLVFAGQAEAGKGKRASEKTRSRVLKEISKNNSQKTKSSKVKTIQS